MVNEVNVKEKTTEEKDAELQQLNTEIEIAEVKKQESIEKKVEDKVKQTMSEEKAKQTQEDKITELTQKMEELANVNQGLQTSLDETKKSIEDMPAQRKGIVSNVNPTEPDKPMGTPTQEEKIALIEANAIDKHTTEYALRKTLGLITTE